MSFFTLSMLSVSKLSVFWQRTLLHLFIWSVN